MDIHDMRTLTRFNSCTTLVQPVYAPTESNNNNESNCLIAMQMTPRFTQPYLQMSTAPLTPSANALMKITVGCAKTFFS